MSRLVTRFLATAALAAAALLAGCGEEAPEPQGIEVSKAAYGDKWPFKVDKGVVRCVGYHEVVLDVDGQLYGLNGKGRSRHLDGFDIALRDKSGYLVQHEAFSEIAERGRKLCED